MKITQEKFAELYKEFKGTPAEFHRFLIKEHEGSKHTTSTYSRIKTLKAKGLIPLEAGVSVEQGTVLTGMSRYHKLEDGGVWVKSDVEKSKQLEGYKQAILDITQDIKPTAPATAPAYTDNELTTFYPLPDLHIGLLVHGSDAHHGQNWDVAIATDWITKAMGHLVATATPSKYAVVTDLGDLMHAADDTKQTKSGHHLDVDGRHSKIVRATFDIIISLIDQALTKHEIVYFYSILGNHSDQAPTYLKAFLSAWYKDEPRVIIGYQDKEPSQQYHIFGKNILMFSHGHQLRPGSAAETLVADNAANFSESEYRYAHFGRHMAA